jgi:hypothetical protein
MHVILTRNLIDYHNRYPFPSTEFLILILHINNQNNQIMDSFYFIQ